MNGRKIVILLIGLGLVVVAGSGRNADGLLDSRTWALAPREGAAAPELAPVFHYDAEAACFRGPPGGPEKPWEIDRQSSAEYCGES